jgi:hypothetical protein
VSEQQAEQTSGEVGSVSAGPAVATSPDAAGQTAAQETPQADLKVPAEALSPDLAPGQGESQRTDAAEAETPKADAPKAEAPRVPGKIMIMSSGDRSSGDRAFDNEGDTKTESAAKAGMLGKRRVSAMAAVVALAAVAGALGGALATAGVMHFTDAASSTSNNLALEANVARIDADILALKASVEQTSKLALGQYNKTGDRLDKVEKAQAEPAARLAKLSETVDKLRVAQVTAALAAAAPAAAKDVTGSTSPHAAEAVAPPVPLPAPKPELARLPTVEGWVLRDVANGVALIEGRRGLLEVYAGDPVPGLGRVDAIRRQDGRWVVVTTKGLVVSR